MSREFKKRHYRKFSRFTPDVQVENHGSLFLFRPMTGLAKIWIKENVDQEAMFFGNALVVEHRYIEAIVEGAKADGLKVT